MILERRKIVKLGTGSSVPQEEQLPKDEGLRRRR